MNHENNNQNKTQVMTVWTLYFQDTKTVGRLFFCTRHGKVARYYKKEAVGLSLFNKVTLAYVHHIQFTMIKFMNHENNNQNKICDASPIMLLAFKFRGLALKMAVISVIPTPGLESMRFELRAWCLYQLNPQTHISYVVCVDVLISWLSRNSTSNTYFNLVRNLGKQSYIIN